MADSNSKQPICPCGFFGTPQNNGLCSKCYKDHQKKVMDTEGTSSTQSSVTNAVANEQFAKAFSQLEPSFPSTSQDSGLPTMSVTAPDTVKEEQSTDTDKENDTSKPQSDATAQPEAAEAGTSNGEAATDDKSEEPDPDKPVQKNKKRCFKCNCKLELAIREIGKCLCGYVFCQLHRLPEQHDCIYDHKEKGRQEARSKMVSPKKHVGASLRRIDSES